VQFLFIGDCLIMSKKIIIGLVSFGLATAVSTVNAKNVNYGVTDIQLRASSSATPPSGPNGYTRIGYWDVDGGGSKGTNGSTGHYMMALYINKGSLTGASSCVTDVQLRASSSSRPPNGPAGYKQIGYWDVDGGGSHGTNGSTGHFMMAMYANTAKIGSGTQNCVADVQLTASNTGTPRPGPNGYKRIGDWDVNAGGSMGTDGSTGHWRMATYMKSAAVHVENCQSKKIAEAYTRTGAGETLVAPFTSPSTSTTKSYSGLVEVIVSGTGYSYGMTVNDAFFGVKTGKALDPQYYQLNIGWNGAPVEPYSGESRNIANFIKFVDGMGLAALPAYNSKHSYHFVMEVPKDAGRLSFGVSDGGFDENGGQYNIKVYPVKSNLPASCSK